MLQMLFCLKMNYLSKQEAMTRLFNDIRDSLVPSGVIMTRILRNLCWIMLQKLLFGNGKLIKSPRFHRHNEEKFPSLEEERPDALEMAA